MRALIASTLLTGCQVFFPLPDSPPSDAATAFVPVQQASNAVASDIRLTVTLDHAPEVGNVLILVGGAERNTLQQPTADGAVWSFASRANNNQNLEIWYAQVATPETTVTIECSDTGTTGHLHAVVTEWHGLFDTLSDGGDDGFGGGGGTAIAGPIVTHDGPDLLIFGVSSSAMISQAVSGSDPGTSWQPLRSIPVIDQLFQSAWFQVVQAPGSYSGSTPVNDDWDAGIAAFRIAPGSI